MGLMTFIKGQKALRLHSKGQYEQAQSLYEELVTENTQDARVLLAYSTLLIREARFAEAKAILIKTQKAPGITADQKAQLIMDYSVCCFKLGQIDKGLRLLEKQHAKQQNGVLYETLGYLYVEKYDASRKPSFEEWKRARLEAIEQEKAAQSFDFDAPAADDEPPELTEEDFERDWANGIQKAVDFNMQALDYDEEDSIVLDNIGQLYYRVLQDKQKAKEYFDKAIAIKDTQIDTLWFLSRYDLESGNSDQAVKRLETALDGRFSPLNYITKAQVEQEISRIRG